MSNIVSINSGFRSSAKGFLFSRDERLKLSDLAAEFTAKLGIRDHVFQAGVSLDSLCLFVGHFEAAPSIFFSKSKHASNLRPTYFYFREQGGHRNSNNFEEILSFAKEDLSVFCKEATREIEANASRQGAPRERPELRLVKG